MIITYAIHKTFMVYTVDKKQICDYLCKLAKSYRSHTWLLTLIKNAYSINSDKGCINMRKHLFMLISLTKCTNYETIFIRIKSHSSIRRTPKMRKDFLR